MSLYLGDKIISGTGIPDEQTDRLDAIVAEDADAVVTGLTPTFPASTLDVGSPTTTEVDIYHQLNQDFTQFNAATRWDQSAVTFNVTIHSDHDFQDLDTGDMILLLSDIDNYYLGPLRSSTLEAGNFETFTLSTTPIHTRGVIGSTPLSIYRSSATVNLDDWHILLNGGLSDELSRAKRELAVGARTDEANEFTEPTVFDSAIFLESATRIPGTVDVSHVLSWRNGIDDTYVTMQGIETAGGAIPTVLEIAVTGTATGVVQFAETGNRFTAGVSLNNSTSVGEDSTRLEYYEEGTWAPTPVFLTATDGTTVFISPAGQYTRIGNLVKCSFQITIPANTDLSGIQINSDGFPFNESALGNGGVTGNFYPDSLSAGAYPNGWLTASSNGTLLFFGTSSSSDTTTGSLSYSTATGAVLHGGFTYLTDE